MWMPCSSKRAAASAHITSCRTAAFMRKQTAFWRIGSLSGAYLLNNSTQRVPWGDPVIFSASKSADYALTQTVELDGKQGDILTFGGWIMADVVSNNPNSRLGTLYPDLTDFRGDRFAGFTISYEYATIEDGETVTKTETVRKAAQDFITDWQYVSESVQLLGDCTEVTFSFEYENHPASISSPHRR